MAKQPNALICTSCGASSPLPAELDALAFDCQYCGNHQLLPQHVVDRRRKQHEQQRRADQRRWEAEQRNLERAAASTTSSSSGAVVGVVFGIIAAVIVAVVVIIVTFVGGSSSKPPRPVPPTNQQIVEAPAEPSQPSPPPLPEETEANNGLTDIRARMSALHEAGCDRVLVPPTRYVRGIEFSASFGNSGHCVVILGATGMPDTTLQLHATDAHGGAIETPAPAPAFEWRYCPTLEGEHPFAILHEGRGSYHLAAYDCPKRRFAKLDPVAPPFAAPSSDAAAEAE